MSCIQYSNKQMGSLINYTKKRIFFTLNVYFRSINTTSISFALSQTEVLIISAAIVEVNWKIMDALSR